MASCAHCGTTLPGDARFCPGCAAPVAGTPAPPSEERKVATVLFADLVGSTELGGSQDPERTRALLDRFYDAMAGEIALAGGKVEKFVGDAVMAAFGAPAAQEDHCERALHAALSMHRRLRELFGDQLALRIGVNTGEVVVGRAREGSSFVTGDAVNVAARLEQAAAPGEILLGDRTAAAVRGAFELGEPRLVGAKGKPDGVTARRLVRALSLMRPRGIRGLPSAFVGRDRDMELLQATYRRVAERAEPHLVTILGDAGVGKTTVVRQLWEWLGEQEPEPVRRTGRCLPYGRGITYWPLGEILKEHLGIGDADDPACTRARLADREILGLTLGLDVAGDLHPLAARDRLHEAWVEFLAGLASERPTVVLVEDLHWAEDDLLDLLERTVRDVAGAVMLIGTARPELVDRRRSWGSGTRNASLVWLDPLPEADTERMVDELVPIALPPAVRETVVERAEGNPFFVEELLGSFIDRGILVRENGGWIVHEPRGGIDVPDSVQAVLASRIDLLPVAEKAALQAGAVIGRVFWPVAVRALTGDDADWGILEERDFIRRRPGSSLDGEREYAIKHALTREVAYATLPKARRAHLHAAFAEWLERRAEGNDALTPLVAHHYAEAVSPEDADLAWEGDTGRLDELRERARRWLRHAATAALRRYEIEEAVGLLTKALELATDEAERAILWRDIGRANVLRYDGEAFWTALQNSLAVCHDRDTCGESYAELAFHTAVRAAMWKRRPDADMVRGWIDRALDLTRPGTRARALAALARAHFEPETGGEFAREATEIADALGDVELQSSAMDATAVVAAAAGQFDEAYELVERRTGLADRIDDPDHLADIAVSPIRLALVVGRLADSRRYALLHDELTAGLTPHHRVHGIGLRLEEADARGDWDEIALLQARAEQLVTENLATPCILNARSLLACAHACLVRGDAADAERLERDAAALGMEGYERALNAVWIRLALRRGDLRRAAELVEGVPPPRPSEMINITTLLDAYAALRDRARVERDAAPWLSGPAYYRPFALRALGIVREDDRLVGEAAAAFDELGLAWHASETRALLATPG